MIERQARRNGALDVLDRAGPLDLAKGRVNRHELVPRDDAREHDPHGLRILAPRSRDRNQRTAPDHLPAFGRHRDFEGGIPASAGAARSCLAPVMVGQDHDVGNRNEQRRNHVFGLAAIFRGRADGHGGDRSRGPARKETGKQAEVPGLAVVRASNAQRWSSVMLVVMAAVSRAVAQEDRSPALGLKGALAVGGSKN